MSPFSLLKLSKTISEIGNALRGIVWPLLAFTITNDPKIMIVIFVLDQLVMTVASLFAPYVADRFNRKYVLIIDELICGICLIPFVFLSKNNLWMIYPLTAIWALSNGLVTNLQELIIDGIKTKDSIRDKLADYAIPLQGVAIIFCIIGSFLVAIIGSKNVFIVDSISFFICAFLLCFLPYEYEEDKNLKLRSKETIVNYFKESLIYTFKNRQDFKTIIYITMVVFLFQGLATATYLQFIKATLKAPDFFVGISKMLIPAGCLLIVLINKYTNYFRNFSNEKFIVIAISGFSLSYLLMSVSMNIYTFLFLFFVSYSSLQFYRLGIFSIALEKSDEKLKSRVSGNLKFAASMGYTLGEVLALLTYNIETTGRLNYVLAGVVDLICVVVFVRVLFVNKMESECREEI